MNEVLNRIAELEHIKEVSQRYGIITAERWTMAELAEMKAIVKRGELRG